MQLVPRNSGDGRVWPVHCQQRQALITEGMNLMILAFYSTFCSFAKTLSLFGSVLGTAREPTQGSVTVSTPEGLPTSLGKMERQEQKAVTEAATEALLNACVYLKSVCLTFCDPMDCSPPGSSVHGILQARILVWVALSYSGGSSQPWDQTCILCTSRQILYH